MKIHRDRWRIVFWTAISALLLPRAACIAQLPCRYEVSAIIQGPVCASTGHAGPTIGTDISPNGRYVCGYFTQCPASPDRAFVYDASTSQFTILPHPSDIVISHAWGVNDAGLVVGELSGVSISRGFIFDLSTGQYTQQLTTDIPSGQCVINAINSSGTVCGFRTIEGPPLYRTSAFVWSARRGLRDLGFIDEMSTVAAAINDAGLVTGWIGSGSALPGEYGFLLDAGSLQILPPVAGGVSSQTYELDSDGRIGGVGRVRSDVSPFWSNRAVIFRNGTITIIPPERGYRHSYVTCVADNGAVFGGSAGLPNNPGASTQFVWNNGTMRSLNQLLPSAAQLRVNAALSVSAAGHLTGHGVKQGQVVAFVLVPARGSPADVTGNCAVNVDDLLLVINEWGKTESSADINNDGVVDVFDLMLVLTNWSSN